MLRPIATLGFCIAGLCACASPIVERAASAFDRLRGPEAIRPVILISIDSFHPDYLDRGLTPTLQRLADEGVRARWMTPSFPTKTFPNHYSMVTGLVPDHHGIIDNTMVDAQLGRFTLQDRDAVGDGRWWGGEPVWVTARRAGLRTATMFWPGSEAAIQGRRPDDWLPFDAAMTLDARVDGVLAWLDRGERRRPHFISLYIEHVDSAGHRMGPESAENDAAIRSVDAALARLVDGLERRNLAGAVNLVIVSDHGMAELLDDREILLEDIVNPAWVDIVGLSEIASFQPRPGREADVESALLKPLEGIACYRRDALPAAWNYGTHPRVPAIVCQLEEGWRIRRRDSFNPWTKINSNRGAHGYDPQSPSMRALFIAHGPAFRSGVLSEPFPNIHVYPLLMRLLGLDPVPGDADPAVTAPMLRPAPSVSDNQKSVQP